jgi:hypothetical protein
MFTAKGAKLAKKSAEQDINQFSYVDRIIEFAFADFTR